MKVDLYKLALARILGNDKIFLYWKGRVALYAILKAMGISPGDEVILPGFTCVVVPNAIKYLGATPVYVDIKKGPMNSEPEQYEKAITPATKVLITQNTFGLSYKVDEIAALAKSKGIFSIEDCTHGFGGTFKGKPNGSYCDAAFFSTQWNKPFSTGIGGFASVNNDSLLPALEKVNRELIQPSGKDRLILSSLLFARDILLNESTFWQLRSMYRFLSRNNLVIGSSGAKELTGTQMPDNYFKDISELQVNKGIESLKTFTSLMKRRKENGEIYTRFLTEKGKYHVNRIYHDDHCFLKYPLLVNDRAAFEKSAFEAKIALGDWFCSPLYPVRENWEQWDLDPDKIPVARFCSEHIVNFPTETQNPEKVLKFAEDNIENII